LKFDIAFNACPTTNVGSVLGNIVGENYCGKKATSRVTVPLYYFGLGGTQNNYTVTGTGTNITICAEPGAIQSIIDTIYITNIGGFGVNSGATSGKDSITVTIPTDPTHFLLSNFTVGAPFSSPTMGVDAFGKTTLRVLIPAGQAINSKVILPLKYDLTPILTKNCELSMTILCNYSKITSPVLLGCAAKSLTCGTISSAIRGTGSNVHKLSCCPCTTTLTVRDTAICKGASVNVFARASGVKGTLTYSTNGTTWSALTNPTNVTSPTTQIYYIRDSLKTWCQDIDTMTLTINQLPDFTLTKPLVCPGTGEDVHITGLTNAVAATSQVQTNAGTFYTYPSMGISLAAGTHSITVKNAEGCQTSKSILVGSIRPPICLPVMLTKN
jgi:hypothetical protein